MPFTTDDLTLATTPSEQAPGRYLLRVPDGWQQGRGAFGGLVLGALVRAVEMSEPEKERLPRTVNGELAGPVMPGDATIEVGEIRRGSGLSVWNATLAQEGKTLARASAVLARARSIDPPSVQLTAPSPPSWAEVEVLAMDAPFVPIFARHMEFRNLGPLPFSGAKERVASGWVRPRRAPAALGAAEVVAIADAWWPSVFAMSDTPRPVATVGFSLQYFPAQSALDPAVPLYYRASVVAGQDGYFVEVRELWTAAGQLVALNQQTMAWIR